MTGQWDIQDSLGGTDKPLMVQEKFLSTGSAASFGSAIFRPIDQTTFENSMKKPVAILDFCAMQPHLRCIATFTPPECCFRP